MTSEAFKRGKEIEAEKERIDRFSDGLIETIQNRVNAQLTSNQKERISQSGLEKNIRELIVSWANKEQEQLNAEFAAL